ncbi:cupin domain-containing protein [Aeromicrobium sp. NPDC092404]|uniref:cupin domain-containing protein n=1 Tax=Aeromicrobium sp. NPDC092404 TaxID=3154976 RepID=UPI00341403D7
MRPPLAETLDLEPHPEGGWFRRTWASPVSVQLPDGRVRPTATVIYFFLPAGEASVWHRVASDEVWLAHDGAVVIELGGFDAEPGVGEAHVVGLDLDAGELPQLLVPAGVWQRTRPSEGDALVSCLVSPGFDFDDFEIGAADLPSA